MEEAAPALLLLLAVPSLAALEEATPAMLLLLAVPPLAALALLPPLAAPALLLPPPWGTLTTKSKSNGSSNMEFWNQLVMSKNHT